MIGDTNKEKLFALLDLYCFSAQRQLYTLRSLRERLDDGARFADLRELIDEAIAFNDETLELRDGIRRRGKRRNRHANGAAVVDRLLDKALSGLASRIRSEIEVLEPENLRAIKAADLLSQLFPDGVAAITNLPYVEQASEVRKLLDRVEGPLAEEVERFGLRPLTERIQRLHTAYLNVLGPKKRPGITGKHIIERQREGDVLLRYIAAYILVHFGRPGVDDDETCENLLGPILAQNQDLKALFKDRRAARRIGGRLTEPEILEDDPEEKSLEDEPALESKPDL